MMMPSVSILFTLLIASSVTLAASTQGKRQDSSTPTGSDERVVMIVGPTGGSSGEVAAQTETEGQWLEYLKPTAAGPQSPDLTAMAAFAQKGESTAGVSDSSEKEEWLTAHNAARAQHAAGKLQWRDDLHSKAKANAELCTGDHSNPGENIANRSGGLTPKEAVDMWMSERSMFKGIYDKATGHFSQVVWKGTTHVGCYIAKCAPGTAFEASFGESHQATCEYDPAGNNVAAGEMANNVQL